MNTKIDSLAAELPAVKTAGNKSSSHAQSALNSVKALVAKLEQKVDNNVQQQQQSEPVGLAGMMGLGLDGELAGAAGEQAEATSPPPHPTQSQIVV